MPESENGSESAAPRDSSRAMGRSCVGSTGWCGRWKREAARCQQKRNRTSDEVALSTLADDSVVIDLRALKPRVVLKAMRGASATTLEVQ